MKWYHVQQIPAWKQNTTEISNAKPSLHTVYIISLNHMNTVFCKPPVYQTSCQWLAVHVEMQLQQHPTTVVLTVHRTAPKFHSNVLLSVHNTLLFVQCPYSMYLWQRHFHLLHILTIITRTNGKDCDCITDCITEVLYCMSLHLSTFFTMLTLLISFVSSVMK